MLNRQANHPRFSLKTVESVEPLTADEFEEKALSGWRHVRTVPHEQAGAALLGL